MTLVLIAIKVIFFDLTDSLLYFCTHIFQSCKIMTDNASIKSTAADSGRVVFLDYLRFIACFMVILVHSIEPFYLGGEGTLIRTAGDAAWSTFLDSALRAAVPLFVMASSYLQLPLKYDTWTFFKKRLVRVGIPVLVWSLMYALIPLYGSSEGFDRVGNIRHWLLNFTASAGHLWFVYMLVGVYLIMPLLSPWIEKATKKEEAAFLGIWAFTTLTPFIRQIAASVYGTQEIWGEASWNEFGTLYYVSGFIGYVVLGHYFRKHVPEMSWKKTLAIAVPLWIVGYAVTAGWFWANLPSSYPLEGPIDIAVHLETSWKFCASGVMLTTVAYFMVIRKITCTGQVYRHIVRPVSDMSYGMYLMHIFVLVFFFRTVSAWEIGTPATIFLTAVFTFVSCSVLTWLLKFIPGSKFVTG